MSHVLASSIFWAAAAVCAIAQFAILRSAVRARARAAAGTGPRQSSPATELLWVLLPALILAGTLLLTWQALGARVPIDSSAHASRSTPHAAASVPSR